MDCFFLAKKVIVVGDNMQISPLELALIVIILLGSNSNTLRILNTIRRCLLIAVFTTMKIRFDNPIVLREHFRCAGDHTIFEPVLLCTYGSSLDQLGLILLVDFNR